MHSDYTEVILIKLYIFIFIENNRLPASNIIFYKSQHASLCSIPYNKNIEEYKNEKYDTFDHICPRISDMLLMETVFIISCHSECF